MAGETATMKLREVSQSPRSWVTLTFRTTRVLVTVADKDKTNSKDKLIAE